MAGPKTAADFHATEKFGTTYIVIPNPMYGDWEEALYQGNFGLPLLEKEKAIRTALETSKN